MGMLNRITTALLGDSPKRWEYPATQIGARTQSVDEIDGELIRMKPYHENKGIVAGVTLLQALHDVRTSPIRRTNKSLPSSFELWFHEGKVKFYMTAPTSAKSEKFRRRINSAYPNANVFEVQSGQAFPSIDADDYVSGVDLDLERSYYFPIRTYNGEGFEHDPYAEVTSEMLSSEETSVVVQVMFKAAKEGWSRGTADIAEGLRQGEVKGWINPRTRDPSTKDREAAKIVEEQRGKYGFHTNLRVLAASPAPEEAQARARGVAAMFVRYYNSATEQGLTASPISARKLPKHVVRMHHRKYASSEMLLGVDALAGIAHLPSELPTPLIDRSLTREGGSAPADLERADVDHGRGERAAYAPVTTSNSGAQDSQAGASADGISDKDDISSPEDIDFDDLDRARFDGGRPG